MYDYDAFGNERDPDEGDANPFRYSGEYFDGETATYYLRARYYDPATGRFLTEDGYGFMQYDDPLSLNLYTYCHNNPLMFADPSGNNPVAVIAIAGKIILAALAIVGFVLFLDLMGVIDFDEFFQLVATALYEGIISLTEAVENIITYTKEVLEKG